MSDTVCRYFATNSCTKGQSCRYLHSDPGSQTSCVHFQRGKCTFGGKCKNLHDKSTGDKECFFFRKGTCNKGATCQFRHDSESPLSDSPTAVGTPATEDKEIGLEPALSRQDSGWRVPSQAVPVRTLQIPPNSNQLSFFADHHNANLAIPFFYGYPPPNYSFLPPVPRVISPPPSIQTINLNSDSPVLCQEYLRGGCKSGDCRLRHALNSEEIELVTSAESLRSSNEAKAICQSYLLQGRCNNQCRLRHHLVGHEIDLVTRLVLKPFASLTSNSSVENQVEESTETNQASSTQSPPAESGGGNDWNHWESGHWGDEPSPDPEPPTSQTRKKSSSRSLDSDSRSTSTTASSKCHLFPKGKCGRGARCPFSHDLGNGRKSSKKSKKDAYHKRETDPVLGFPAAPAAGYHTSSNAWNTPAEPKDDPEPQDPPTAVAPAEPDDDPWASNPPTTAALEEDEEDDDPWGLREVQPDSPAAANNEKEVEPSRQSQLDDEATWSMTQWDEPPLPTRHPRINKPCLAFGQGVCQYKDEDCQYLHIRQPDLPDESGKPNTVTNESDAMEGDDAAAAQPAEETEPPFIDATFLQTDIRFGPGVVPEHITTRFESPSLLITNLSSTAVEDDVQELCGPYGVIESIALDFGAASISAQVDFSSPVEAAEAAAHINGLDYETTKLSARVRSIVIVQSNIDHKVASVVKMTWSMPTRSAWAYYEKISEAKLQASKINNTVFAGRIVTAEFEKPRAQPNYPGVVKICNLPLDVDKERVKKLCTDASVVEMAGKPAYTETPVARLSQLLQAFGEVDQLDVAQDDKAKKRAVTFARFTDPDAATAAITDLNGKSQAFLGDKVLNLSLVHSIRYSIPRGTFLVIKEILDQLVDKYKATIYVFYLPETDKVHVRLASADHSVLHELTLELKPLVHGEVVVDDAGRVVWDDFLETDSGLKNLARIDTNPPSFITYDYRTRSVTVFGVKEARQAGIKATIRFVNRAQSHRHSMLLDSRLYMALLRGGAWSRLLQEPNGGSRFSLDFANRTLVVRGDDGFLQKTSDMINSLVPRSVSATGTSFCCTICSLSSPVPSTLLCGHTYCKRCLQVYLLSLIGSDFSRIRCLGRSEDDSCCDCDIPYMQIQQLLTPEEFRDILESSFTSYVRQHTSELRYCPTSGCQMVYRPGLPGTMILCPVCTTWICSSCHTELHDGLSCEEYLSLVERGLDTINT